MGTNSRLGAYSNKYGIYIIIINIVIAWEVPAIYKLTPCPREELSTYRSTRWRAIFLRLLPRGVARTFSNTVNSWSCLQFCKTKLNKKNLSAYRRGFLTSYRRSLRRHSHIMMINTMKSWIILTSRNHRQCHKLCRIHFSLKISQCFIHIYALQYKKTKSKSMG